MQTDDNDWLEGPLADDFDFSSNGVWNVDGLQN